MPAPRAGWQLEWVREPPPPPPLPPPPPPPPGPFAAARGERGGAAAAAMEPDSVIEDKTIELMVSAALGTVRSSVRPAPQAGLAHTSTSGARPALALPAPGLGPGAVPPDPGGSRCPARCSPHPGPVPTSGPAFGGRLSPVHAAAIGHSGAGVSCCSFGHGIATPLPSTPVFFWPRPALGPNDRPGLPWPPGPKRGSQHPHSNPGLVRMAGLGPPGWGVGELSDRRL